MLFLFQLTGQLHHMLPVLVATIIGYTIGKFAGIDVIMHGSKSSTKKTAQK